MSTRTWQSELQRFREMNSTDQLIWLSQLLHLISMFARDTYEVGTEGVVNPSGLRRFNELIHRVATFQKKVAKSDAHGVPDEVIFNLLETELETLHVAADDVISRLP